MNTLRKRNTTEALGQQLAPEHYMCALDPTGAGVISGSEPADVDNGD